jgi:hypothetical protein
MTASAPGRPAWLTLLAGAVVILGFLNFLWFFSESSTIGDASRGYIRDGRYYLVHAARATEVSRQGERYQPVRDSPAAHQPEDSDVH